MSSASSLSLYTQIPAEVISSDSAPEHLNIPVFIRSRLKHCRGPRSQWSARLVKEDIRRVLFPVLGIENLCCVLFNPSVLAVSKVHPGCIFSVAPFSLSIQFITCIAFVSVAVNPEMSLRTAAFKQSCKALPKGGVKSPT